MMRVADSEGSREDAQKCRLVSRVYCVHQLRTHTASGRVPFSASDSSGEEKHRRRTDTAWRQQLAGPGSAAVSESCVMAGSPVSSGSSSGKRSSQRQGLVACHSTGRLCSPGWVALWRLDDARGADILIAKGQHVEPRHNADDAPVHQLAGH